MYRLFFFTVWRNKNEKENGLRTKQKRKENEKTKRRRMELLLLLLFHKPSIKSTMTVPSMLLLLLADNYAKNKKKK